MTDIVIIIQYHKFDNCVVLISLNLIFLICKLRPTLKNSCACQGDVRRFAKH